MKKLLSMILVLVLSLSCLCAYAQEEPSGTYELTQISGDGLTFSASDLGMNMSFDFKEDGTATMYADMMGEVMEDSCTWTPSANGITLLLPGDEVQEVIIENGRLIIEDADAGMVMYLDKDGILPADADASMDLSGMLADSASDYDATPYLGTWTIVGARNGDAEMGKDELGMDMTIQINDDNTAVMSYSTAINSQTDIGSWYASDAGLVLVDSTATEATLVLEGDVLSMSDGSGVYILLEKTTTSAPAAASDVELTTFTHAEQGYTVSYPADWFPMTDEGLAELMGSLTGEVPAHLNDAVQSAKESDLHMVYMPDYITNFNIIGQYLGMTADAAFLEALVPSLMTELQAKFGDSFTPIEAETIVTFGDKTYAQIRYTYELMGVTIYCAQYFTSFNDNLYIVSVGYDGTSTFDTYADGIAIVLSTLGPIE